MNNKLHIMKTSNFCFVLLAILISACGSETKNTGGEFGSNQEFQTNNDQNMGQMSINQENRNSLNSHQTSNGKTVFKLKDGQGKVFGIYPVPENWKKGSGEFLIESNDGVKVTNDMMNEFTYSHIPDYNQMLRESNVQVKPVKSLERFIKEDLVEMTKPEGMRLTNIQRTPAITQLNAQRDKVWFKAMPEQMNFDSAIVDFVDAKGNPSFLLINYYVGSSQNQKRWGYSITGVESPKAIFEQTKKNFIYAVMNSKLNPKYVQMMNQKNQQTSQKSAMAHNNRMAQIRSFGENNTRNFNARGAAFDAQNNSWRNGQIASDRMHTNTINGINEVDTWTDGSGNNFEVDGYYNKVYTNGTGEYMGTDDYNYNPNIDPNVNGNWEESNNNDNGWNN